MVEQTDPLPYQGWPGWLLSTVGNLIGQTQTGVPPAAALAPWAMPVFLPGAWRGPFVAIGVIGTTWVILWLFSLRRGDLPPPVRKTGPSLMSVLGWLVALLGFDVAMQMLGRAGVFGQPSGGEASLPWGLSLLVKGLVSSIGIALVIRWLLRSTRDDDRLPRPLFVRRFAVLCVTVVVINLTWHFFRAWLPMFLQTERAYQEKFTMDFFVAYYIASGAGSLAAGFLAVWLARRGYPVHGSRVAVFIGCALLCTLSVMAAVLPAGNLLLGLLLVIAFASLALFPLHYSFTQELTVKHQGKLSGSLGCITWLASYLLHDVVGTTVKQTGSNAVGVALAGLLPLLAVPALLFLWGKTPADQSPAATPT
jgi:hypothetical protein